MNTTTEEKTTIEKIQHYIDRTKLSEQGINNYRLMLDEIYSLLELSAPEALDLAFTYGMAKGYRMAKAEAKKEKKSEVSNNGKDS